MKKYLCLSLVTLSLQAGAYVVQQDVVYDRIDGKNLVMDVYLPSKMPSAKMPAIVFVHGGCFNAGSKKDVSYEMRDMADLGMAIFSVSYRLADVAKYPAGVIDVQQAVRHIRQNAQTYSIDPQRMAVHGESAGGYLAAVLGLKPLPDRKNLLDKYSSRVPFVSNWYGRTDFTLKQTTGTDCAEVFLGTPRTADTLSQFKKASLLKDVDQDSSPMLIIHGSADQQVAPLHSTLLANEYWKKGQKVELFFYENEGHGFTRDIPWKLTKNRLLKALGMTATEDLTNDNVFVVDFTVQAQSPLVSKADVSVLFGAGPQVPLFPGLTQRDTQLPYSFGIISKTRKSRVSVQNYTDARDQGSLKVETVVKKLTGKAR